MAKYPDKRLENQSNQRSSIHRHVKSKCINNPPQQSAQKMEATKVNAIMEQLNASDGSVHKRNININHFVPLFE